MNDLLTIYEKLPVFAQNILVNVYSFKLQKTRYNSDFKRYLREFYDRIDENDFSFEEIEVNEKLFEFLEEASNNDFWSKRFERHDITISRNIDLKEEIKKLPVLTKDEVIENEEAIKNPLNKNVMERKTGGTTGRALHLIQTQEMENKQYAVWWRYRKMHGLTTDTWVGWFGGKQIVPATQEKPPFWRIDYFGKQVMFSAIHLSRKTAKLYYNEIKKHSLSWLHGYPSQIALFASYISDENLPPIESLKIITTGAENLTDRQKEIIREAFDVPVRQHYGLAEGVANISEWPDGKMRVDKDFSYVEFLPVSESDPELCKIVGTNFSNPAFPLIRFDTGDIARISIEDGEEIVESIEGRVEDYITLSDGKRFGPMNLLFKELKHIKEAQVYQPALDELVFRIVKDAGYDKNRGEEKLRNAISKKLTDDTINISVEYFEKLPRTKSAKLKTVISDIK
jgi:phenylacetate-CoA ligase